MQETPPATSSVVKKKSAKERLGTKVVVPEEAMMMEEVAVKENMAVGLVKVKKAGETIQEETGKNELPEDGFSTRGKLIIP